MTSLPPPLPARSSRLRQALTVFVVVCTIVVILGVSVVILGWSSFVSYGVATDFSEYQEQVRTMQLDPELKQPLLLRLENLRERVRTKSLPFLRWMDYDESIRGLIDDGELPPDEFQALTRELDRVETALR